MQMTVAGGVRASTAHAYLAPVKKRRNLTVVTGAGVDVVMLERGVATGVAYHLGNRRIEAVAAKEVILAAGAIGSPVLLQRSGIGPTGRS